MSEQSSETNELGEKPTSTRKGHSGPTPPNPPGAPTVLPEKPKPQGAAKHAAWSRARRASRAALWFGMPWVERALSTVSTDDAYVSGTSPSPPGSRSASPSCRGG